MSRARRGGMMALGAFCVGLALSGCANGNVELDPAYWFPDGKKKIPGERRELFPEGVPGVTQGIPPEMIRGNPANQPINDQVLAPAPEEAPPPPQEAREAPKPRPKRVARPRPVSPPPPEPAQSEPAAPPPSTSGWPAPPATGTFTR